jgi:hypothetical protein
LSADRSRSVIRLHFLSPRYSNVSSGEPEGLDVISDRPDITFYGRVLSPTPKELNVDLAPGKLYHLEDRAAKQAIRQRNAM